MPKVLSNSEYTALKQSADNYKDVVSAILGLNSELKQEDITADIVKEMITQSTEESSVDVAGLKTSLEKAQSDLTTAQERVKELETENANLLAGPGADSAEIVAGKEADAKTTDISDFADKNVGDTLAILAECKEQGII